MAQVVELEWESIEERSLKDSIYNSLQNVKSFGEKELEALATTIHKLLVSNPKIAQSLFNVLLYYLERGEEVGRENIIVVVDKVVVIEAAKNQAPHFTNVVKNNINLISHGCDRECKRVRSYLHQCIAKWTKLQVVPRQFLLDLHMEERRWSFRRPTPKFPVPQEESPTAFDLAMAGITGRGITTSYLNPTSMTALVKKGMEQGVQDGWLSKDDGHHRVIIEKAL